LKYTHKEVESSDPPDCW